MDNHKGVSYISYSYSHMGFGTMIGWQGFMRCRESEVGLVFVLSEGLTFDT
jgi:hypothetical protein